MELSKRPDVSVLVPAFNAETTLERAVRSALMQTGVTTEVIIIDDCSQDRTAAVARSLQEEDDRVRLLSKQDNGGVSRARNDGLRAARGTWVTPLDADDSFEPGRLQRLFVEAERLGADLMADNVNRCDGELRKQGLMFAGDYAAGGEIGMDQFIRSNVPGSVSLGYMKALVRRSFIDAHGIDYAEDIECAEDWYFYFSCLLHGARLFLLPDAYYNYAIHPQSYSRQRARMVKNAAHVLRAQERAQQLAQEFGSPVVAQQIGSWLPHHRRYLLLQRTKKLLLDIPLVAGLVDWRKRRRRNPAG